MMIVSVNLHTISILTVGKADNTQTGLHGITSSQGRGDKPLDETGLADILAMYDGIAAKRLSGETMIRDESSNPVRHFMQIYT